MDESADSLREQRKRETRRALTDAARRLTAERGFTGFTVEEVCTEVGVSRRTFFNYFESKENAVFGFAVLDPRQRALDEEFVAQGPDVDLVDAFVSRVIRGWELFDPLADASEMFAVVEREPRLLKAAFAILAENERRDVDLILRRQGDDDRLRAEVVVHSVGALVRMSVDQLLHHQSALTFRELVTQRLEIARSTFAPTEKAD
ncbi:AcrR family transcriptional regulator [Microbacterium resistens]|uniref:AcrR family transcriptional regulator n=1 Tax=Microbacterium resistens TaxID=156977 RepID=A0ABU1SEW2_9MICO|nr:TetR/AcrR family transcriptional regulator [Microbacterium resistens]MDR6867473.1 AcrR family transcriptional regulator [Microbacterium resistens]